MNIQTERWWSVFRRIRPQSGECTRGGGFAIATVGLILLAVPAGAQLGPPGTQFFSQDSPDVPVGVEENANFGQELATGDFDCDGYDDLAIGMPGDDLTGAQNAGRLVVFWGTADGVTAVDSVFWGQNSALITGTAELNDRFSSVMAVGDFNGDDCDDLAIGVGSDNPSGVNDAGAVNILFGSAVGLTGDDDQYVVQAVAAFGTGPEAGDRFGSALAVGDFNDDGLDDLAVGSRGEDWGAVVDAGVVHILFGFLGGLCVNDVLCGELSPILLRRGDLLQGPLQEGEGLGTALAAGNLVIDLFSPGDELAIGAPRRDVGGADQAGVVVLVSQITTNVTDTEVSQDTVGIASPPEDFDRFGSVLAVGNFDGLGVDELVVGVPEEDFNGNPVVGSIGVVHVFDFISGVHQSWTQEDVALAETNDINDRFGAALAVGDFNNDGADDLAVGAPGEHLGPLDDAGLVHVLYGTTGIGLTEDDAQLFFQAIQPGEALDEFGAALATGRFRGTRAHDLVVGAPLVDIGDEDNAGAINIFYSFALFSDGFEVGDVSRWN